MSQEPTSGRAIKVGKFYTSARKFKQLIGQLPDGTTIPGGPYTLTQFVPSIVLLIPYALKIKFFGWGSLTAAVMETLLVLGICALSIFALGQLPPTRRSLFHIITTYPNLILSDKNGYWKGNPLPSLNKLEKEKAQPALEIYPQDSSTTKRASSSLPPKLSTKNRPTSGFNRFQNSLK